MLTVIIALVTLVAHYHLLFEVIHGLVVGAVNTLNHRIFQAVFGEIMTVLIALKFNHTLIFVTTREQSVIQVNNPISHPFGLHARSSFWS